MTKARFAAEPPTTLGPAAQGVVTVDLLEAVYFRPDVRAAIASNCRAFAELLSHDPEALTVFGDLSRMSANSERDEGAFRHGYVAAPFVAGYDLGQRLGRYLTHA